jgi:beta-lactamase regulating signal transducer with metallopeptidase domain
MSSSLLLEAALRSVLLALAVWVGLRLFGVKNVLAQKAAWGLVLVSALGMPMLLPYAAHWSVLPANVRVVIPDDPQTLLEELQARLKTSPQPKPLSETFPAPQAASSPSETSTDFVSDSESQTAAQAEANPRLPDTTSYDTSEPAPQSTVNLSAAAPPPAMAAPAITAKTILTGVLWFYIAVAGILILRLFCGLFAALRLLQTARRVTVDSQIPNSTSMKIRSSARVASPVTICSSIVLPADYETWESNKLRIVLAHERSHIRQGDFYLQLLAGVYAAAVWFSPLGWWLKRKLSDLAEAISDRAGLEEAADRTAYAQILLEFAAAPRPTLIGVAMARSGSLSRRIERLLNDASFRQAFAGTRRGLAAVVVVPIALFAATALVRVEASGQQEAQAVLPTTGTVTPEIVTTPEPQQPPEAAPKPEPAGDQLPAPAIAPQTAQSPVTPKPAEDCAPAPVVVFSPPAHITAAPHVAPVPPVHTLVSPRVMVLPGSPMHSMALIAPAAPGSPRILAVPHLAPTPPNASMAIIMPPRAFLSDGHRYAFAQNEHGTYIVSNGKKSGYRYYVSKNGDSYAIVKGNGSEHMSFNGDIHTGDIDKARQQAGGKDFLWFSHEGKSYIVDDPATLAQIEAMYKPMEDLGRQQEELGKKQEVLGKQQEDIGHQQEQASVPTPDMSKEIAEIEAAMTKLKASQGKNLTQDQFAEMQEKLGELQGRIGEIQGEIGSKQGEFGERMGELGSKMGELGEQMGRLGEQQGKIASQADQKVKSIIDQSLKDGKAHPIQ